MLAWARSRPPGAARNWNVTVGAAGKAAQLIAPGWTIGSASSHATIVRTLAGALTVRERSGGLPRHPFTTVISCTPAGTRSPAGRANSHISCASRRIPVPPPRSATDSNRTVREEVTPCTGVSENPSSGCAEHRALPADRSRTAPSPPGGAT